MKENFHVEHIERVTKTAENAAAVHCYDGAQQQSLFTSVLLKLKSAINEEVAQEWLGNRPPDGQVIEVENPADFARFFSALLFLFCQVPTKIPELETKIDDIEVFGVGFLWGGCAILHLLGLTRRFMMLDFTYYILKLDFLGPLPRVDQDPKKKKGTRWTKNENILFPRK
eukprot:TRINITY_DN1156_c0_g1_i2.p1 TRINITY_DN1156_c0_g1~~TRINITY_DN1156_c0_g1_i2.p1  ORF type:complete len:170 (+),score=23.48 TRINITY_DN1156_c0_g1_i2:196-705(+)